MTENDIQWLLDLVRGWLVNGPGTGDERLERLSVLFQADYTDRYARQLDQFRCSNELTKVN